MNDGYFNTNCDVLNDDDEALLQNLRLGITTLSSNPSGKVYFEALRKIANQGYRVDTVAHAIKEALRRYLHYHRNILAVECVIRLYDSENSIEASIDDYYTMPYRLFPYLPNAIVTDMQTHCDYLLISNTLVYQARLSIKVPEFYAESSEFIQTVRSHIS